MRLTKDQQNSLLIDIQLNIYSKDGKLLVPELCEKYKISRQTLHSYIKKLTNDGRIKNIDGVFKISKKPQVNKFGIDLNLENDEDKVYKKYILPNLPSDLKENIKRIIQFGFTEIFNNIVSHAEVDKASIALQVSNFHVAILVEDKGVGIFNRIQRELSLDSPREAIFELAKGGYTSDPQNHSGKGIFYSSRMFDVFLIRSEDLLFSGHDGKDELFIDGEFTKKYGKGTGVYMIIFLNSETSPKEIFDKYACVDNGFQRTDVDVSLLSSDGEDLVSRTQGRRLMLSLDKFCSVVLNFKKVNYIGHSFADEVFRVFQNEHPELEIIAANTNEDVKNAILRVNKNAKFGEVS